MKCKDGVKSQRGDQMTDKELDGIEIAIAVK